MDHRSPSPRLSGFGASLQGKRIENEELARWTKEATAKVWSQILEDHETENDFMMSILWRSTDFFEARGRRGRRKRYDHFHICV